MDSIDNVELTTPPRVQLKHQPTPIRILPPRGYRPPSLSESSAYLPENVLRAAREPFLPMILTIPEVEQEDSPVRSGAPTPQPTSTTACVGRVRSLCSQHVIELIVKLSLHIAFISVFETLFFFFFVSDMENNGLDTTVGVFFQQADRACSNLTSFELYELNAVLQKYVGNITPDRAARQR